MVSDVTLVIVLTARSIVTEANNVPFSRIYFPHSLNLLLKMVVREGNVWLTDVTQLIVPLRYHPAYSVSGRI